MCNIRRKLLAHKALSAKAVEVWFENLKEHLERHATLAVKRYKFYCRNQPEDETVISQRYTSYFSRKFYTKHYETDFCVG